jgi:CHAD domain-containing protein
VKAKKVKGLDPRAPLRDNAARIVVTRLEEMRSFALAALTPDASPAQHDMRIAAKRLRYVLETVGICFGEPAEAGRQAARELQTVLGEVHDCDVRLDLIGRHLERSEVPPADRGLELLLAHTAEQRDNRHADFAKLWTELDGDGVLGRLVSAAEAGRTSD